VNAAILDLIMRIPGQTTRAEVEFLHKVACFAPLAGAFVELGTYHGRTAAALCWATPWREAIVTIDDYSCREGTGEHPTPEGVLENLAGIDDKQRSLRGTRKARVLRGDTRFVPKGTDAVSLLFVDSEHTRAQFDAELAVWLPLVVARGIVVCHDYGSPTWLEMTEAITSWLGGWERIGLVRRMIAFRRPMAWIT
jgi:hypothetical protein